MPQGSSYFDVMEKSYENFPKSLSAASNNESGDELLPVVKHMSHFLYSEDLKL